MCCLCATNLSVHIFVVHSYTFICHVCEWIEILSLMSNKETLKGIKKLNKSGELDH
jgi:hypothetical protein